MRKIDAILLAVLLAVAAVLGTLAVTRSVRLGIQSKTNTSQNVDAIVAVHTRKLNANEAALRRALAKKPPKLPALPALPAAMSSQRTVSAQTQPIVVVTRAPSAAASTASGEPEHEHEQEREHNQRSQEGERDD